MKTDWKQKLSSRKLWAAVAGFVTPLIIISGYGTELATEVAAIIMSGAALISYIIGEGLADAAKQSKGEDENE